MRDDLFDDLLGGGETAVLDAADDVDEGAPVGREFRSLRPEYVYDLDRGVTITWLGQAFTMGRKTVELKLAKCPVLRTGRGGTRIYDFRVACQYLVNPVIDLKSYLSSLDPKDMPEQLRSEYWRGRINEQKARLNAGDLWRTEDVEAAFGEIFKLFKETVKLWTDSIEETTGITDEQRETIDELARELLTQIGDSITQYCGSKTTPSQQAEFETDDL